ncbi:MAG: S9 family peptidase [Proteobacteria bacterium]|nr:S9 family peptidase [Pseudomonadota bacterium]
MKTILAACWILVAALAQAAAAQSEEHGPAWLNEHSARTIQWIEAQDARTLGQLRQDPRFATLESAATEILTDPARFVPVTFIGDHAYQYWQTHESPFGIWRRTLSSAYLAGTPSWETVIDVQALATAEHQRFLFAGAECHEQRCLISLSRAGKDAVEQREFDLNTKKFVRKGFHIPESKTETFWYDADTLLVAPAFDRGEMTEGLTPRTLKVWRRGTPLGSARKIFEGADSDAGVGAMLIKAAGTDSFLAVRHRDFERRDYQLMSLDGRARPMALPEAAAFLGSHNGKLLIRPEMDWVAADGVRVPRGSLAAIDLGPMMREAKISSVEVLYTPSGDDSIRAVHSADGRLFVELLHDYASRIVELSPRTTGGWQARTIPLPGGQYIQIVDFTAGHLVLHEESPLLPDRVVQIDPQSGQETQILFERHPGFDASNLMTEYNQVRSSDGTLITYSVTRRRDLAFNHSAATLVYAYGGFDVPLTPRYEPLFGKLWMERGGVYVHAYLRGGGEHGPDWHWGVMRENRHLVYDDMAAVLRDLQNRGVTQPSHTGIMGRSNGGLMTAAVMERYPELMNAVVVGGPLTDMLNFIEFPPGSTWTAEYGDPRNKDARDILRTYSPMQNIAPAGTHYPTALIITSTDDDRVLPGQARRFSALLEEKGHNNLYFEDAQGGHYWELAGGPAPGDWRLRATARAVEYTYLWQQLGQEGGH